MTRRLWKIVAFLLVLVLLSGIAALWRLTGESGRMAERVSRLETEVSELRLQAGLLPEAEKRLRAAEAEAAALKTIVPEGNEPAPLARVIQGRAEEAGVSPRWIQIRSVPLDSGTGFTAWRYSLLAEGGFDELAGFMNSMEQFDQGGADASGKGAPFFEITDLNMSAGDGRQLCTLVMYTYRPDGEWLKNE